MSDSYQNLPWLKPPPPPPPPFLVSASPYGCLKSERSTKRRAFSEFRSENLLAVMEEPERQKEREEQEEEDEEEEGGGGRRCLGCCAWTILGLFAFTLVALFIGLLFVATLRSGLPDVRVVRVDFPKIDIVNKEDTLLNSDVQIQIQVSNNNQQAALEFGPLVAEVSSENMHLGQANIPGFSQTANNSRVLKVSTQVRNFIVNEDDAMAFKTNAKSSQVVMNIVLSGHIGFRIGLLKLNWVPAQVVCQDIRQADLDLAREHICKIVMFR